MGDWHNNRSTINLVTLDFSLKALELMSNAFQVFFIPGNHDLYFRDKRDIQGAEWARHIPNITIVNEFFKDSDVSIVPWLVKDEHKKIEKITSKYCFGHFELPHFYMNAQIQMPDHGEIQQDHFKGIEQVFSGHFHKRQNGKNINYIGNCFPHNYSDVGDDERGCMVLEWGEEPEYFSWPDQPKYRIYQLSHLLNKAETILKPKMHVRVNLDIDISYEEATFVKETFVDTYKLRELTMIPVKKDVTSDVVSPGSIQFLSVDQIVNAEISQIKSDHYDPKVLIDIYRNL